MIMMTIMIMMEGEKGWMRNSWGFNWWWGSILNNITNDDDGHDDADADDDDDEGRSGDGFEEKQLRPQLESNWWHHPLHILHSIDQLINDDDDDDDDGDDDEYD